MNLPNFIPGPWRRGEGPSQFRIYSPDGLVVCEIWARNRALGSVEQVATAQLIEAAPDMFKALKTCEVICTEGSDAHQEVVAALKKALGE
jgi:hypothetical protein